MKRLGSGMISISLSGVSPDHYLLSISDNGMGIPDSNINKPESLGIGLFKGLSEDLDGTFSIENINGTLIKKYFVHDMNVKRSEPQVSSFVTNNHHCKKENDPQFRNLIKPQHLSCKVG